jgi:hypothetical protein
MLHVQICLVQKPWYSLNFAPEFKVQRVRLQGKFVINPAHSHTGDRNQGRARDRPYDGEKVPSNGISVDERMMG